MYQECQNLWQLTVYFNHFVNVWEKEVDELNWLFVTHHRLKEQTLHNLEVSDVCSLRVEEFC